jgi:hypothetical protein
MRAELTSEITAKITAFIRAGGFPHVAAEAAGVPRETFEKWLFIGNPTGRKKGWKPHKLYTPFWLAIMEAKATARLTAEIQALKNDPVAWLKSGPGKDQPNNPGWSSVTRPVVNETNQQINVLLSPEMQGVFASLLQVLQPFPEARAAVARALAGGKEVIPMRGS